VTTSANANASRAGLEILHAGGNAFDAAAAIGFAIGVVEPNASGIGGGGLMVAYNAATSENLFWDMREFTPGTGIGSALVPRGIPTAVAGFLGMFEQLGSGNLTRQEILDPAITLAEEGFAVDPALAAAIGTMINNLNNERSIIGGAGINDGRDQIRSMFTDEAGLALGVGDTLRQPNYGKVLREIAEHGNAGFYQGWVAEAMIQAQAAQGVLWTAGDLAYAMAHFPRTDMAPLTTTFLDEFEITTVNMPSAGGVSIIQALNMIEYHVRKEGINLADMDPNGAEYAHIVATAMQLAMGDRRAFVSDTRINPQTGVPFHGPNSVVYIELDGRNPMEALICKEFAGARWRGFEMPGSMGTLATSTNGPVWNGFRPDRSFWTTSDWIGPWLTGSLYGTAATATPELPWGNRRLAWGSATFEMVAAHLPPATPTQSASAAAARAAISATAAAAPVEEVSVTIEDDIDGNTTHWSVTDRYGNMVSITATINTFWGNRATPTPYARGS
jgi:gamma-glutamyltranspeptidase